jgi:hypothetical protein
LGKFGRARLKSFIGFAFGNGCPSPDRRENPFLNLLGFENLVGLKKIGMIAGLASKKNYTIK